MQAKTSDLCNTQWMQSWSCCTNQNFTEQQMH